LNASQQTSITQMEMKSGFPVGTIEAFMLVKPGVKPLSINTDVDENGNKFTYFVYQDERGNPVVSQTAPTGGYKAPTAPEEPEKPVSSIKNFSYQTPSGGASMPLDINNITSTTIEKLRKAGAKNEDIRAWLDVNTKLTDASINSLLKVERKSKLDETWLKQNFPKKLLESDKKYNKRIQEYLTAIQQYVAIGMSDKEIIKQMK